MEADRKKIIVLGLRLLVPLLVAAVAFVAYGCISWGWFTLNGRVSAEGMSVRIKDPDVTAGYTLDGRSWYEFDQHTVVDMNDLFGKAGIRPGDVATLHVRLCNKSPNACTVTGFGLCLTGAGDETPLRVDGVNYYLGTQISAVYGEVPDEDFDSDTRVLARPIYDPAGDGRIDFFADGREIALPGGSAEAPGVVDFYITFAFVDTGVDQNVYQGFGSRPDGRMGFCRRAFWLSYE